MEIIFLIKRFGRYLGGLNVNKILELVVNDLENLVEREKKLLQLLESDVTSNSKDLNQTLDKLKISECSRIKSLIEVVIDMALKKKRVEKTKRAIANIKKIFSNKGLSSRIIYNLNKYRLPSNFSFSIKICLIYGNIIVLQIKSVFFWQEIKLSLFANF